MLSVIIPVYNAERYLQATVESVMAQEYNDFEAILVNDGSSDRSGELCESLAERYSRIKVIHKDNGGVGSARNAGIDAACGKYVTFIDADDKIGDNMFSDLLNECESKNVDKAFCGFDEILENGTHITRLSDLPSRKYMNREQIINTMLLAGCLGDSYMNSVCGGVYKTELLRKHGLRFRHRPMGEDWYFNMQYCDIIESAVYINEPYYQYLRNEDSATSRYHPQQFELWLENRELRRRISEKYNFETDVKAVDSRWITKVLFYSVQVINRDPDPMGKLKQMFGNAEFVRALSNATQINHRLIKPVAWLLKKHHFTTAVSLLRVYSTRFKHKL